MKIAVSATGNSLDAAVDPRFGRAAKFVLVDTETKDVTSIDNTQNLNAPQGAGIQSAQAVSSLAPDVVLTGHCGPKAFRTLQAADIQVAVGASGTVAEAIEQYEAGKLSAADAPDVEGHWI
mgnify:CR=1 FL=1